MTERAKYSPWMIALAVVTLTLSSYGLFRLAHDFGDIPTWLAFAAVAGFDVFAIAAGQHAMTIARDGDSAGMWNLAVLGAALLSAVLQYAHTQLADQPVAVGVMMAAFPIATVSLFEGTLRRAHRLNGRRTGRVSQPRASFELLQWLVYPRITMRAFRHGVLDRTLGADAVFKIAYLPTVQPAEEYRPPARRELELSWEQIVPGMSALTSGLRPGESGSGSGASGESGPESPERPETRPVSALVEEFVQVSGLDRAACIEHVKRLRPDVQEETIRKAHRTAVALRSA